MVDLPKEIQMLSALEELLLSENDFTEVQPEILKLGALKKLDMSHNKIAKLAPDLPMLKLEALVLHHNLLVTLPGTLGSMECLR